MNPIMHEAAWKLVTKWIRNLPSSNSLHVSAIPPYVSSCFTYCFPSFFEYFPCFPWCFSRLPLLGLTHLKLEIPCSIPVGLTRLWHLKIFINFKYPYELWKYRLKVSRAYHTYDLLIIQTNNVQDFSYYINDLKEKLCYHVTKFMNYCLLSLCNKKYH